MLTVCSEAEMQLRVNFGTRNVKIADVAELLILSVCITEKIQTRFMSMCFRVVTPCSVVVGYRCIADSKAILVHLAVGIVPQHCVVSQPRRPRRE
jgi:hypothetical protein